MAKKSARRNGGRVSHTSSQKKRQKRLQHFNFAGKLARRRTIEGWDDRVTLTRNYKTLGIAFDANAILSKPNEAFEDPTHQLVPEKTGIMTERLQYLQSLPPPAPYEVKSMNVQEQYQLQRLIQRHADDYEGMQGDLKLNINQMTATKLQKRIELMFRLQHACSSTSSSMTSRTKGEVVEDEDFGDEEEDEDFDDEEEDEDFDDEEEEEEEEGQRVIDTTGLSELEAERAIKKQLRVAQRAQNIKHNNEVNQRFKSGLTGSQYGAKICTPKLSQLINTRGPSRKDKNAGLD